MMAGLEVKGEPRNANKSPTVSSDRACNAFRLFERGRIAEDVWLVEHDEQVKENCKQSQTKCRQGQQTNRCVGESLFRIHA